MPNARPSSESQDGKKSLQIPLKLLKGPDMRDWSSKQV